MLGVPAYRQCPPDTHTPRTHLPRSHIPMRETRDSTLGKTEGHHLLTTLVEHLDPATPETSFAPILLPPSVPQSLHILFV